MTRNDSTLITGGTVGLREKISLEKAVLQSSPFDIHIVKAQEQKGIEAIRQVLRNLARKPFLGPIGTVVILEADSLTVEAQNALLKVLEEPPNHSQLIITAQSKSNLLATVSSRCVEIEVSDETEEPQNTSMQELLQMSLHDRLELIEKTDLADYSRMWRNHLRNCILNQTHLNLKWVWSYNKLILKFRRAQKVSVNKKLISLFLALELPKKG